jgi:hypothetical protein
MHRPTVARAGAGTLIAGLALVLSACVGGTAAAPSISSAAAASPGLGASASMVAQVANPSAPPNATPAASPANVGVGDGDNGHTVMVPVGSTVTLVLTSTYWQVQGSSDPAVLALVTGPTASGAAITACVPGAGCGAVTTVFHALASGRASIAAARTTCGEAMRCTGSAGAYAVTIVVGG